ncbi:LLM class flavin-dependent oxidoreductase [Actinoalloteichus hymeniacidonis]|uniref:Luciferase-like monooxygenase n=1 Tax=Actinoalloteichus hymeniacidonis TaxID=340345 RepID=A0AAC9HKW1_9PSEU|nr:LLM class flavin-dependent oxidoreductase [Actinoalloteichus hymeniacidonis]AOS60978.1 Luciferase-like monooxygenase [Actinoalloteichus hymeniacidonis]MBB5911022.1 alkanesulfonate monooxygenase SsuD/methylene tetrahydromethanopterin reductase-like flavin-dependent oxidoreductase (luciferase family) [Actinoalloteichus hymeniacidonis]
MRIGIVILPEYRWWIAEPKWRAVETYGFDHAWTYDHLGWRSLVDEPWFGAIPTLTAAAMVTSRIRLGTLVASPNFRHPVPFAREVTALDDVSDGRLQLGIGAGGTGFDLSVLGSGQQAPQDRAHRFEEFVELLDALLTKEKTTWQGEHFHAVEARSTPGCVQQPRVPFLIAANAPSSLALAARFGQGWLTNGDRTESRTDWWRSVEVLARRMNETLDATGRRQDSIDRYLSVDSATSYSMGSVEQFRDVIGRAAELGFTDVVAHWPRSDGVYAGNESVLEQVAIEVLPARHSNSW